MVNEQKKKTAQTSSVGADDQRSISQKNNITIPDFDAKNNPAEDVFEEFYRQIQRMQDPTYLHTVTLDELMERVFQGKAAVVENLLYTGAYILAGAPKMASLFWWHRLPIISVREGPFGGIRYGRERCFTWLWRMTRAACSVECTECLVWKGQTPFTSLPTLS